MTGALLSLRLRLLLVLLGATVILLTGRFAASLTLADPVASVARTFNVTDEARLHRTSEVGSIILEEGSSSGALPGHVKARFKIGASVSASAVLYTKGGTLSIRGVGVLHSSGVYASFAGTMSATSGTGRYAHAHGSGGFYGVVNRRDWKTKMQITGKLSY